MADLSPSTRRLLETYRTAEVVPTQARARVWSRVMRTVAVGGAVTAAGTATGVGWAASGAASSTLVVATKWVAVGLVAAATGSIAVKQAVERRQPAVVPAVTRPEKAPHEDVAPPQPAQPLTPAPSPGPTAVTPAPPQPKGEPSAPAPSILDEARLLEQAQRDLSAGSPERALGRLDQYRERHARGALDEEAQATRVLALCAAGRRAEGQALAERFASDHPRSPLLRRVLAGCAPR
jgi:hypothetical protein